MKKAPKDVDFVREFQSTKDNGIIIITGTKMSNCANDIIFDPEGRKHFIKNMPGQLSYIICEDRIYTTDDILKILETELQNVKDKSTVSIMIGIDN